MQAGEIRTDLVDLSEVIVQHMPSLLLIQVSGNLVASTGFVQVNLGSIVARKREVYKDTGFTRGCHSHHSEVKRGSGSYRSVARCDVCVHFWTVSIVDDRLAADVVSRKTLPTA